MLSSARAALLLGAFALLSAEGCKNDEDCSLLGRCDAATSTCKCDAGWTGTACGRADLLPLDVANGYQNPSAASWGGRPLRGPDGKWHLFSTEIARECPLILFMNNSQVVRSEADRPEGPYVRQEVVLPPFHHNPQVVGPTPDGFYLLFTIGTTKPDVSLQIECRGGGPPSQCTERSNNFCRGTHMPISNGQINLAWSKSVRGPWQEKVVLPYDADGKASAWNCENNNPTATILQNGTILLAYRANVCAKSSGGGAGGGESLGVAVAAHWNATYVRRVGKPIVSVADGTGDHEDPFLWQDARGHFHMITHDQNTNNRCGSQAAGSSCAAHLFSRDSYTWTIGAAPVYTPSVTLSNGTVAQFQTRQRPQLVFDEATMAPAFLFSGGGFFGSNPDCTHLTHTYAQGFATAATANTANTAAIATTTSTVVVTTAAAAAATATAKRTADGCIPDPLLPPRLTNVHPHNLLCAGFIDPSQPPYLAKADGSADATAALQQALDDAYAFRMVVRLPLTSTFVVSSQLRCVQDGKPPQGVRKQGFQLIGEPSWGSTRHGVVGGGTLRRPRIILADHSTVEDNILFYFQLFNPGTTPDAASHYSAMLRGVDIDMGDNAKVSAISMSGAQLCSIEDVTITGIAFDVGVKGLPGSGGFTVNLKVVGGAVGIWQNQYRPNPSASGVSLINQTSSAVRVTDARGPLVLSGFVIEGGGEVRSASADNRYSGEGSEAHIYTAIRIDKNVEGADNQAGDSERRAAAGGRLGGNGLFDGSIALEDGSIDIRGGGGGSPGGASQSPTPPGVTFRSTTCMCAQPWP